VIGLAVVSVAAMVVPVFRGPLAGTGDMLWPVSWALWPPVGALILLKRPGNRIGVACFVIGLVWALSFALQAFVLDVDPVTAAWIELAYTVLGVVPWVVIVWLLANFPTGYPAGRLERFVNRSAWVVGAWAAIGFTVGTDPLSDTGLTSPLGVVDSPFISTITQDAGFFFVIGLAFLAVISLVRRFRRSTGAERLQYRWLMLGGSVFVLVSFLGQVVPEDTVFDLLWFLGAGAIPISIGVAVVRYRLYEIDRLISRTVSYVIVVGVLAAVFAGIVTLASSLLQTDSDLAIAASTLAVAALFNPLRRRVQAAVDRRFNRSRYDAERVMDGFAGNLRDEVDPDRVVGGWVSVVDETMKPSSAGVWVREAS
jgi:hypothetical protein